MNILITGYNGFVGKHLTHRLKVEGHNFAYLGRSTPLCLSNSVYYQWDLGDDLENIVLEHDIDVVIHCAAKTHITSQQSESEIFEVNTSGTLNLAKVALECGVKRFIFLSTVKVNGEFTLNKPFTENDNHEPKDAYGVSKSKAEAQLLELGHASGMEIVIIRPPLIYGPGVKANFASLLNLVSKGLPLPFACFNSNKRSMVSLYNLVDLIITCIDHPKAANQVFLVSDDHDLSTADLIVKLSKACGKSGFMLPIPVVFFKLIAKLFGKQDVIERLAGSLCVDISKTKKLLDWTPPQSVDEGIRITADAFLKSKIK